MTGIHADIDALKGLRGALVRYRHAQREVTAWGEDQLRVTRASLEAKAGHCRTQLELNQAELGACQDRAAREAADETAGGTVDCSGYARAARSRQAPSSAWLSSSWVWPRLALASRDARVTLSWSSPRAVTSRWACRYLTSAPRNPLRASMSA